MGIVVLLPGGFKPPHAGHLDLANKYASFPQVEEVRVMIGPAERDGITREQSIKVWEALPKDKKVKIIPVDSNNPMVSAFDAVLNLPKDSKGTYALGSSSKGEDAKRAGMFVNSIESYKTKATKDGRNAPKGVKAVELPVDTKPMIYKGRKDDMNGQGISASILRKDLENGDKANFYTNYPGIDKNTVDQIYKILTKKPEVKEKKNLDTILENRAVLFSILKNELLVEGGAAGHMAHPFDIPSVKTGTDLIKVFQETEAFLKTNEVPVKIDGINSSIRLVDITGKKQFVLDRGSNKPLDVKGITSKDLVDRFGEGHGMIKIGGTVLKIFNEALPNIQKPLAALGMLKNPNIMLNIEYVEGQSNVQKYENNFLVIHNLLEIKQVTPNRRGTEEISYSKEDLQSLIDGLKPTAKKYGFEVFNVIPAKVDKTANLSSELGKSYTVNVSKGKKETKTLDQWLKSAKNTKGEKLKLKDGKTVDALSKQVFVWINDGKSVDELVADPKEYQKAIDSFVIYLATVKLGDAILKSMSSPLGDVDKQEGIVVRNKKVYSSPYKITGSFIIRGMQSAFQAK